MSIPVPGAANLPVLIIHGGAWAIPDDMVEAHLQGVRDAMAAGWKVLERGGSSLDAVENAVIVMEDDEAFDAGRGSFLNREGHVQLDALIMDGATLRAGGVACVERLRNPIRAARLVLEKSEHVYLVSRGAERFAQEHGLPLCDNDDLVIERERVRLRQLQSSADAIGPASQASQTASGPAASMRDHDTVGALALDRQGRLAAATSTGGTLNKASGRVGDSSIIGSGCYAANESAAVSCTGWGEPIMKLVLGKWAVDRVATGGEPQRVAVDAIAYLQARLNGQGGMILLDPRGKFGIAHNTLRMAWGIKSPTFEDAGITRGA